MYRLIAILIMNKSMRRIQEQINALEAEKFLMLEELTDEIFLKLLTEVKNLETGCGSGYTEGDYYASTRYYSDIDGVKNLRFVGNGVGRDLMIKVVNRKGYDLISHIAEYNTIPDVDRVLICKSDKYVDEINY